MRTLLSFVLIVSACAQPILGRSADCPPCYNNLTPPPGQPGEMAGDNTPRKVLHIKIDASWNQSSGVPPLRISDATAGAVQKWNDATAGHGNTIDYYLKVVQNSSAPDFVIVKGDPSGGGFAEINLDTHPAVITLAPRNADMDLQSVAARTAHEVGHRLGLDTATASL